MFFSAFMFTSMYMHFSMNVCRVEGVFSKGCNPLPLLLLSFLMSLAGFFICFFFLSSCLNKAFNACVTHLTLLCLGLFSFKIVVVLLPLGGKSSNF